MTIVMRPTCWHQNFGPNGLSAPAQGLCLNIFSSITADFNISSAIRWAIQDQWSSGLYFYLLSKISRKLFELGSWYLIQWLRMRCRLFHKILIELWPFEVYGIFTLFGNVLHWNLVSKNLENYLSECLDIWYTDWEWGVDYLINF